MRGPHTATASIVSGPADEFGWLADGRVYGWGGDGELHGDESPRLVVGSTISPRRRRTIAGERRRRLSGRRCLADAGDGGEHDGRRQRRTRPRHWADDTVRTDVHNAAHAVIMTAVAGTVVHDNVQVARAAGTPASVPNPTGSVIFHRYATINCSGAAVNQTVALTPGSPSTAESDGFAPTADMSYQAEYLGDANYPAHTGACEPLTVTPAPAPSIAIVKNPKSQTVAIGGTATFSITVTNTGNVTLTDVHVVDPMSPNCNRTKAADSGVGVDGAGCCCDVFVHAAERAAAGFDNVATAIGTPPQGRT